MILAARPLGATPRQSVAATVNEATFDAKHLLTELRVRGVQTDTATSVRAGQWAAAEIYPHAGSTLLTVTPEQAALLQLFASPTP
jgi:hypothetical protein